ncbi:MAG: DUF3320 domain-containing protein, partial [Planctomycetaceae bacterium]|nr:DUF3320 domain-containing protein [Planctomycetaceae bacterium]
GVPANHQWNGCETGPLLPADQDRIQKQIKTVADQLEVLLSANQKIAILLDAEKPNNLIETVELANVARAATKVPKGASPESITADAWQQQLDSVREAIESTKQLRDLHANLENVVSDVAWETDLAETRLSIKAHGKSWFKFLNSGYRKAKATLIGILDSDLPASVDDQITLIDQIREVQKLNAAKKETHALLISALGGLWNEEKSDFDLLEKICEWHGSCLSLKLPQGFGNAAANSQVREEISESTSAIRDNLNEVARGLKELFKNLQLNLEVAFKQKDLRTIPLETLSSRLERWVGQDEALSQWISFSLRLQKLRESGMNDLAKFIDRGAVTHENAADQFESVYYENLMRAAFRQFPALGEFDGESHEQVMERFCELDMERREYARREVAAKHYDMLPKHGAQSGEIGIVRREMAKKSRHMPIRKLLGSAGHAIQAIKPVFMMSPISVAQFLEPGILEFDLLLIDEASQVKPVDALGSIARAKQVIVVGDEKQLPPTNFFNKMSGDDEGEAESPEDFNAKDIESILGLCSAQGINQRMLKWHYRSRHQSLIAVSNHEFYESKLFVVPSPSKISNRLGLSFVHVADGVFERGKSRTNPIEAERVADAVIQHAQEFPDKTLGVASFSVAQRDAILNQIEYRRRNHPELEEFFATGGAEPFFVKNIENVQGDERDTIMISVGYGRDSSGYLPMSFGPLQNDGGERRLNVLISRAKEKCVVFSSITADDIDLNRAKSKGVAAFKTFLTYARTGFLDVGVVAEDRGFDSEFEVQVASSLAALGYDVKSQIGVAGFFVDLAIVDPERPGRYLIGIECDGASYHSSRSARDRDRIRQAVLEDRGWIIHRIWSTDWFLRPDEQLKRVVESIEKAKAEWGARDQGSTLEDDPDSEKDGFEVEREAASEISIENMTAIKTVPYKEASFNVNTSMEIHELKPVELGRVVEGIVRVESPIHTSEIARRVASLWDLNRAGSRITKCVEKAVDYMVRNRVLSRSEGYVTIPDAPIPIRSRESVQSSNLRKPDMLPPAEIQKAILAVVEVNHGINSEELIKEISLLLGFKKASEKLRIALGNQINKVVNRGNVESRNGNLYLSSEGMKQDAQV